MLRGRWPKGGGSELFSVLLYILDMEEKYNHKDIEKKWQEKWKQEKLYETLDKVEGKENFYTLVEFPYPSGNLHIGHWYAFAVPDIFVRTKRMQGYNTLFPIGFDAFGLPAENAAIKRGLDPKKWTYENIAYMEGQLQSMGASFDWSRKVVTADPEYYKWTQWLFLRFFEKGLAYKKTANVNWCPTDQTVLANEQVVSGKCERCGTEVVQKDLEQWFFKITDYAERLLSDLENLKWSEPIKEAQKNWIGKSEGAEISFQLISSNQQPATSIKVFTTRTDTLLGVTYLVLAPEHREIENFKSKIENWEEVEKYIDEVKKKTEIERTRVEKDPSTGSGQAKTGVELKGVKAINPATGEEVPVWVADYVLGNYGTGAVMAVPAHDERDFEFAKKYNLQIKEVIEPPTIYQIPGRASIGRLPEEIKLKSEGVYSREGVLVNSGEFDGLESEKAREKITDKFGKKVTKYKLRDWLLSRQRYWGCPIPIVYDPEGKPHPVPAEHLPWLLPEDDIDFTPKGQSPLSSSNELKQRVESIFGKGWTPEFDTMDTFVDSSWYFNRYVDPKNDQAFASKEKMQNWLPVNRYSGGAEHTTMHLLYARFFHKALFDMGLVNEPEPFVDRMNRALILGPDGQKMSKSKGNVIDPDEQVKSVGADTVRMYLGFIGPYNEAGQYPWDIGGVVGIKRFLERIWRLVYKSEIKPKEENPKIQNLLHKTIKKVTEDIENFKFNTAISSMMILMNELEKEAEVPRVVSEIFLKLLAPFAPHMAEELWSGLGHKASIHLEDWPKYDEDKIKDEKVTIMVQVNGKVRANFEAEVGITENEAKNKALSLPEVVKWMGESEPKKVIFVPNKIISFVV